MAGDPSPAAAVLRWYADYLPTPPEHETIGPPAPRAALPLSDGELLERARTARNGSAFDALWRGDCSRYGGDRSRADAALCRHLAFWTGGDPGRIDRLFRQSALYRRKWERADYRERTIAHASSLSGGYTPGGRP